MSNNDKKPWRQMWPPNDTDEERFFAYDWIEEVAHTPEADVRAHRIALTYSKYAARLDRFIAAGCRTPHVQADGNGHGDDRSHGHGHGDGGDGGDRVAGDPYTSGNANWFHFGTWATTTISRNIANLQAPQRLEMLPNAIRGQLGPLVVRTKAIDRQRVGRALAWSQRQVFLGTTSALLELLRQHEGGKVGDQRNVVRLRNAEGDTYVESNEAVGTAFRDYVSARDWCAHAELRDRFIFRANLRTTAVEQWIVDRGVGTVVDTVPRLAFDAVEARSARLSETLFGIPRQVGALSLQRRFGPSLTMAQSIWSRFLTDQVFVMSLPAETLRLGRDIPPLHPGEPFFATTLRRLDTFSDESDGTRTPREQLGGLVYLVRRFDRTTFDGRGSAARDWRDWGERMNWANTLLRSRQHDPTLFWPPYSGADERRILDGELPLHSGDPAKLEVLPPLDRNANGTPTQGTGHQ